MLKRRIRLLRHRPEGLETVIGKCQLSAARKRKIIKKKTAKSGIRRNHCADPERETRSKSHYEWQPEVISPRKAGVSDFAKGMRIAGKKGEGGKWLKNCTMTEPSYPKENSGSTGHQGESKAGGSQKE